MDQQLPFPEADATLFYSPQESEDGKTMTAQKHPLSSSESLDADTTTPKTFEPSYETASSDNASATSPDSSKHSSVLDDEPSASCGRGICRDFRRTIGTHWKTEMSNFDQKTVAVSFFLFFACIAPAVTFGAIYEKATHGRIGAVEMIAATSSCGIIYALLGGQPMMVRRFAEIDSEHTLRPT